jgi:hypothetical protein
MRLAFVLSVALIVGCSGVGTASVENGEPAGIGGAGGEEISSGGSGGAMSVGGSTGVASGQGSSSGGGADGTKTTTGSSGVNTNYNDSATFKELILCDRTRKMAICDRYTGSDTGAEPPLTGSGPDGKYCIYSNTDLQWVFF